MSNVVFSPASSAQQQFLLSDADVTFYGGAAGAGKSHCLLGSFLKFCHHPRTRGVIFRKTTKQISNPGGLFDSAVNLFKQVDPKLKIKNRDLELVFSSGATLKFAYLDNPSDKYNFQGAELTFIGFDEIQQLSQENVIYLFSRLRSTTVDYKKQIVATGNPDFHSFMKDWVEFALDERGIPIRKDVYPKRYFAQVSGGSIDWADTREALELVHGTGDESGILSFMFVPGTIYDNPPLIKADPTYISKLKALPLVEKERLLYGSWYARESASGYWKRHWTNQVLIAPLNVKGRVRSWDLAFTQVNESGSKNPDYTAGVLLSKSQTGRYTVENIIRLRDRAHIVEEMIISTAKDDGHRVIITLPNDPAGGGAYVRGIQKRLSELGFVCRLVRPTKGKIQRFAPFAATAEGGFIDVVIGEWNNDFHNELETFDGSNKYKDDQADGCSDAFHTLNKEVNLPLFTLPNMQQSNGYSSLGFSQATLPVSSAPIITQGEFTYK
jgi:predicted phage terminase large subunit-like protein